MSLIFNGVDIRQIICNEQNIDKVMCNGITVFQKSGKVVYPYRSWMGGGSAAMVQFCANMTTSGTPTVTGTLLTPYKDRRYIKVTVNEDISSLTLLFGSGSHSGVADGAAGTRAELYKNGSATGVWYCYRWHENNGNINLTYLSRTLNELKAGDVVSLYIRNGPSSSRRNGYGFYSPTFIATK